MLSVSAMCWEGVLLGAELVSVRLKNRSVATDG